ncbi:MAG: disulfide oxidoreductase, partial [Pseudomonadota bacterium]
IDMLERLADMVRGQDSRGGFEATADMLSITGLTLEQFADWMEGLGYQAEKGERPKVKPAPAPEADADQTEADAKTEAEPDAAPAPDDAEQTSSSETEATEAVSSPEASDAPQDAPKPEEQAGEPDATISEEAAADAPEIETFYTFRWVSKRPARRPQADARSDGKGRSKKPKGQKGKGKPRREDGPRNFSAKPAQKDKPIDPDNPFAALMALKEKS